VTVVINNCRVGDVRYDSDCPQLVQLGRIPSEFDVARMRDSFLRQFLEQGGDVIAAAAGGSVTAKDTPAVQSGAAGKTQDVPVLSSRQPKSLSSALARHLAVAEIVRYCLTWTT